MRGRSWAETEDGGDWWGGSDWRIAPTVQPAPVVAPQPLPAPASVGPLAGFLNTFANLTTSDNAGIATKLQSLGIAANGGDGAAGWVFNNNIDAGNIGWSLTADSERALAGWTIGTDTATTTANARALSVLDAAGASVGTVAQDTSPSTGLWALGEVVAQIGAAVAAAYALPGIGGALFGSGAAVAEGVAVAAAPLVEADAAIGVWGAIDTAAVSEGIASSVLSVPFEALASIDASVTAWAAAPDVLTLLPAFEVAAPVAAATVAADAAVQWTAPAWTPAVQVESAAAVDAWAATLAAPDVLTLLPAFEVAAPVLAAPAFTWNAAADSQAASAAAGITGAQAAAAAVVPATVDMGSLGGIISTAADTGITAAPGLGEKLAGQAVKATTTAGKAALSKLLAGLGAALPGMATGAPGQNAAPSKTTTTMQAKPGAALLLLAGLGLLLS